MQATSAEDCLLQQAGMRRILQSRLLQQDATPIWCAALEAERGRVQACPTREWWHAQKRRHTEKAASDVQPSPSLQRNVGLYGP